MKFVSVCADASFGTAQLLPTLPLANVTWSASPLIAAIYIGILTSPPRYTGLDLSTFWAWLRYAPAIDWSNSALRLDRAWSDMDPHQKTVLADDFGVGYPALYLATYHGFEDFGHAGFILKKLLSGVVSVIPPAAKHGPGKCPDFIAIDSSSHLHVLECKGTQKSQAALMGALATGALQKNNLSNSAIFKSCMTGGIFVPQQSNPDSAQIVFADPPIPAGFEVIQQMGTAKILDATAKVSLCQCLYAAGLWTLATGIYDGRFTQGDLQFVLSDDRELLFAGFEPRQEGWEKHVEYRSLQIDATATAANAGAVVYELRIDIARSTIQALRAALQRTGEVDEQQLTAWIVDRRARRTASDVPVEHVREGASQRRTVESCWTFEHGSAHAAVRSPYGIDYNLKRRSSGN